MSEYQHPETEELRAGLTERGIEWWPSDDRYYEDVITRWKVGLIQWTAIEGEKNLWLSCSTDTLTPEQAIAVALGRGTCHLVLSTDMEHVKCDACGYRVPHGTDLTKVRYCGGCGARVVKS